MSSQKTEHYELNQWLATDQVLRTDFNADNAKIDGALKSQADNIAALETTMAQKGNCQIETFTYTGTGGAGNTNPARINFSAQPLFFTVFDLCTAIPRKENAPLKRQRSIEAAEEPSGVSGGDQPQYKKGWH